ncbi:MAG: glycosyltransferase family 1 protein [Chitinophagia bacterium]|nr:glycosyltransferase family 1 protein [Chitinophagia bacterium]
MNFFVNARFLTQPISGVQRYGIECSLQIKRKYPSTVFLAPQNILHRELAETLNAVTIGKNTGHWWEQTTLPKYLMQKGYPPLWNPGNTGPLAYSNNYITIHDLAFVHHPEWNTGKFAMWYNFLIPRLAKKARHIFTVSQAIQTDLQKTWGIATERISITPNGLPENWLATRSEIPPKEPMILCVGSFNPRKNQAQLIRAFIDSAMERTHQLVLVGDKNGVFKDPGLEKTIQGHSNIQILTNVNNSQLRQLYQRAAIVASTSLYEGFGIPLLEGAYFNCNLLCTDIPVYRELFGEVAHFCSVGDIVATRQALEQLAQQGVTRKVTQLFGHYSYNKAATTIVKTITGQ